jgi:hypothetical protein
MIYVCARNEVGLTVGRTLQSFRMGHLLNGQEAAPWPSMMPFWPATVRPFTQPNSIQSLPKRFRSVAALSVPCASHRSN